MKPLNFEGAKQYALARLGAELPETTVYHSIAHTRDEVAPAAEKIAVLEGIHGDELLLLNTAVYFHDLGFVESRVGHEETGARIAEEVLPRFGYSHDQVRTITSLILATKLPHSPRTLLERILVDADLAVLGRDAFMERNLDLRDELSTNGGYIPDDLWIQEQISFMDSHRYFTNAARTILDAQKKKNLALLLERKSQYAKKSRTPIGHRLASLRHVNLFSRLPEETLTEVASSLKEFHIEAGQRIFNKGDLGSCMYIIGEGKVRVHDGEMLLNYLYTNDIFGEMAVLDPEPRSATVTAEEDTLLFHLDQKELYSILENNPGVAEYIIKTLCQRLRARMRDMAEDFEYMEQFSLVVAAAAAVEAGKYEPESLNEIAQRPDELGQLALVFQRLVGEVDAREQRLQQQVNELRIEIDQSKKRR